MTEEARAAKRAYQREWQRRNPDKVQQYCKKHWEKVAAQKGAGAGEETDDSSLQAYTQEEVQAIRRANRKAHWEDSIDGIRTYFKRLEMTEADEETLKGLLKGLARLRSQYEA